VVNKIRALNGWYSKGYEGGADFRASVNRAESIGEVRDLVAQFFF
jgi:tRNA-dihydrouridine synthase